MSNILLTNNFRIDNRGGFKMNINLFSNLTVLEKAMDASWLNHKVISDNIANIDTPNYKRKSIDFQNSLAEALDKNKLKGTTTHNNHIPIGNNNPLAIKIKVHNESKNDSMRIDGNNIDIDAEMALQTKNAIYYNAVATQLSSQINRLKMTLREVGR